MSLSDKKWDGICPVSECNCFHQDEYDWFAFNDVHEAIKKLKEEFKLWLLHHKDSYYGDDMFWHCMKHDDFKSCNCPNLDDVFKDIFGEDLIGGDNG